MMLVLLLSVTVLLPGFYGWSRTTTTTTTTASFFQRRRRHERRCRGRSRGASSLGPPRQPRYSVVAVVAAPSLLSAAASRAGSSGDGDGGSGRIPTTEEYCSKNGNATIPTVATVGPTATATATPKHPGTVIDLVVRIIEEGSKSEKDGEDNDDDGTLSTRSRKERIRDKTSVPGSTLGDIMSSGLSTTPAATTTTPTPQDRSSSSSSSSKASDDDGGDATTLAARYGIVNALDRMALTANGNLQRLVSSYYDAPVEVVVDRCTRRSSSSSSSSSGCGSAVMDSNADDGVSAGTGSPLSPPIIPAADVQVWDRAVRLRVYNQTFCTATSVITVVDPLCQQLVDSGHVGLGQLFRFLDLLPEFTLLDAGTTAPARGVNDVDDAAAAASSSGCAVGNGGGGAFWREYRLDCNELSCHIREDFCEGMWELRP